MAFQSMSSLFQSVFSCSPKRNVSALLSSSDEITSSLSPSCSTLLPTGIETLPLRHRRDITNGWLMKCDISRKFFPNTAGLCT